MRCTSLLLIEELVIAEMVPQIPTSQILHGHIEVFAVLEGRFHVDDEGVGEVVQDGALVEH